MNNTTKDDIRRVLLGLAFYYIAVPSGHTWGLRGPWMGIVSAILTGVIALIIVPFKDDDDSTELTEYQPKFTADDARKAGRFLTFLAFLVGILSTLIASGGGLLILQALGYHYLKVAW